MTTKNLTIVGLRLLAIYCFIQSVPLFLFLTFPGSQLLTSGSEFLKGILPGVSLLLLSVLLFVYSVPLAGRLAPVDPAGQKEMVCTFEQLQAIALAVAGIVILVEAVPSLVRVLAGLVALYNDRRGGYTVQSHQFGESWAYLVAEIGKVLFGLLLLLNPRGFRNAWHRLRTAGTGPTG